MFNRIIDILPYQIANYPQEDTIASKVDGKWKKFSASEFLDITNKLSMGLLKLGLKPGDNIAIISENRPEFNFIDLASLQIGVVNAPMYPNISEKEYAFIFNEAEIKYVFVSNKDIFQKVENVKSNCETIKGVYTFDKIENANHWSELKTEGNTDLANELQQRRDSIKETDLATIIYTSGTTGTQKGVMLSHKNIISNIKSLFPIVPHGKEHRALSFLPLCHIFERTLLYFYIAVGTSVYYAENLEKVVENLQEVKPHFFNTVPRLLEKVYEKILLKGKSLSGAKKSIFFWAVNLGLKYDEQSHNSLWYNMQLALARKLVFSKWQAALGGNVIGIITGAAALQLRLAKIFNAVGIKVREGYGLTECSPVLTFNQFEDGEFYFGTVGPVIPNVEIKIAENGEIIAKGDNIMMGYYKHPEFTKEVIDDDGWFHTGDIGEIIDGKFLKITDRLKQIFKTSGGKYVAPQPIENKMVESPFIEQIMVVGENRRFTSALIVPAFPYVKKWCELKKLNLKTNEEIANSPEVLERIWQDVQKLNKDFGKTRKVKKIKLLANEWTDATGELTPTQKVKRKVILKNYEKEIAEIYVKENLE
jgi:long-chain acyl-CoA synthetase